MSKLQVETISHTNNTTGITISSSGIISQPNKTCFHVSKTSDQTITDATLTLVTFDSITDGAHSGRQINVGGGFASNKFTVTAQTTGIYFFYTSIAFNTTNNIEDAYVYYRKNGSAIYQLVQSTGGPSTTGVRTGTFFNNCLINLDTSGDYIELMVYADISSGGTMNLNQNAVDDGPRTNMGAYKIA